MKNIAGIKLKSPELTVTKLLVISAITLFVFGVVSGYFLAMSKAALGNSNAVYLFTTTKTPTATCAVIPTETPTPTVVNPAASNPNIKVINTKDFLTPDGKLDLTKAMTDNIYVVNQIFAWAMNNSKTADTVSYKGTINSDDCSSNINYAFDVQKAKALIQLVKDCAGGDPSNVTINIDDHNPYMLMTVPLSGYENFGDNNSDIDSDISFYMHGISSDMSYGTTITSAVVDIPLVGKGIKYIYTFNSLSRDINPYDSYDIELTIGNNGRIYKLIFPYGTEGNVGFDNFVYDKKLSL